MNHLKYKKDTKKQCLEALDHLNNNDLFKYFRENCLEVTASDAVNLNINMDKDDPQFAPLQGISRIMTELVNLSRNAHVERGKLK